MPVISLNKTFSLSGTPQREVEMIRDAVDIREKSEARLAELGFRDSDTMGRGLLEQIIQLFQSLCDTDGDDFNSKANEILSLIEQSETNPNRGQSNNLFQYPLTLMKHRILQGLRAKSNNSSSNHLIPLFNVKKVQDVDLDESIAIRFLDQLIDKEDKKTKSKF